MFSLRFNLCNPVINNYHHHQQKVPLPNPQRLYLHCNGDTKVEDWALLDPRSQWEGVHRGSPKRECGWTWPTVGRKDDWGRIKRINAPPFPLIIVGMKWYLRWISLFSSSSPLTRLTPPPLATPPHSSDQVHARQEGICQKRRELYSQCFDEVG